MRFLILRPDSGIFTVLPPLGLMALAAYFRENSEHTIRIYEGREKSAEDSDIVAEINDFQPDVIGISVLTMERIEGHHTANVIKTAFPDKPIIMGGPYPTSEVEEALENPSVDYVVLGEGEIVGLELINALESNSELKNITGIAFRNNGEIVNNGIADAIQDLDSLPQMAWDMIELEKYFFNPKRPTPMNLHVKTSRSAPILTTRGCPYRCTYCHNLFGKRLRKRSVEHVLTEIKYLKEEKGVQEIEIVDDVFNLDSDRAIKLADRIIEEKLNLHFSFPNGLRADMMPDNLIDKLVEMGTYRIVYAVESGSPQIQKEMRKNLNLDKARHAIEYTTSKGISVGGFFILGFLNETEEQAQMTIDFAIESKLSTASFFILSPFPKTEIYHQAMEAGYNFQDTALTHYYALGTNISKIPDDKLHRMHNRAYRKFYLHPVRLFRFFRTTPWHKFFFRKVWIALLFFFHNFKAEKRGSLDETSDGKWKRSKYS